MFFMKSRYSEMHLHYGQLLRLIIVCILLMSCFVDGIMNKSMRDKLLALHNDARHAVQNGQLEGQPKAVSLKPLRWNNELERKAQHLSDQCRVGHDNATDRKIPEFEYVGQNWAGASKVEINRKCRKGDCGHYTQIVWEGTTDVGCGVTYCPNFPYGLSIVCNYGPGGNYIGEPPYSTIKQEIDDNSEQGVEPDTYTNYNPYSQYRGFERQYF